MGGGKSAINHYVTPLKSGRVIVEVGGHIEFIQVLNEMKIKCLTSFIDNWFLFHNF